MQITMTKLFSEFTILLLKAIARLPFGVLYFFSDCLYILVYTVLGYRKKVVRLNLSQSFPNKNAQELRQIERDFYHNLCDTIIETIKSTHITEQEIKERVTLINEAYVADLYAKNKKIFAMQGHYANWEWPALAWCLLYPGKSIGIYKPLTNPFFDQYYFDFRSRFGMQPLAMNDVARTLIAKRNEAYTLGIISDQTPVDTDAAYWTTFLNQPTAVFLGTEKLAKQFDATILFLKVNRIKRGYYEMEMVPICENPKETDLYEITEKHVRYLESIILAKPADWLWSHRRWKHQPSAENKQKFQL